MIGKLYKWLFNTHRHEWETIKEQPYKNFKLDLITNNKVTTGEGVLYTLRCKTCGEISDRKVGV